MKLTLVGSFATADDAKAGAAAFDGLLDFVRKDLGTWVDQLGPYLEKEAKKGAPFTIVLEKTLPVLKEALAALKAFKAKADGTRLIGTVTAAESKPVTAFLLILSIIPRAKAAPAK